MKSKENVGAGLLLSTRKLSRIPNLAFPKIGEISRSKETRERFKSLMKILGDQTKLKPERKRKKIRGLNIRKFDEYETRLKSQLQQHSARQFAA